MIDRRGSEPKKVYWIDVDFVQEVRRQVCVCCSEVLPPMPAKLISGVAEIASRLRQPGVIHHGERTGFEIPALARVVERPADYWPGTVEKAALMAFRYCMGVDVHVEGDRQYQPPRKIGVISNDDNDSHPWNDISVE